MVSRTHYLLYSLKIDSGALIFYTDVSRFTFSHRATLRESCSFVKLGSGYGRREKGRKREGGNTVGSLSTPRCSRRAVTNYRKIMKARLKSEGIELGCGWERRRRYSEVSSSLTKG